ncbi:MAG: hypothetical protein R3229_16345 [Alphaproteobacteria bacterium]|nr:hypothetical protein [Alphaproteobacteria bacterium]
MSETPAPEISIVESGFAADFGRLDDLALRALIAAGEEVLDIEARLAKTGDNVVGELLKGQGTFYEWNHYPDGDVYDPETGSQFFYHAHPADQRIGEHGHFHTFMRPAGMPEAIKPAPVADLQMPEDENDALSHLIGISMDAWGKATCLFTVNRWVTGEVWYGARDVISMLERFEIGHTQPSWPVNRWISAMVRLYRPEIEALVEERDAAIAARKDAPLPIDEETGEPVTSVFESRALEITSFLNISVPERMAALAEAARG